MLDGESDPRIDQRKHSTIAYQICDEAVLDRAGRPPQATGLPPGHQVASKCRWGCGVFCITKLLKQKAFFENVIPHVHQSEGRSIAQAQPSLLFRVFRAFLGMTFRPTKYFLGLRRLDLNSSVMLSETPLFSTFRVWAAPRAPCGCRESRLFLPFMRIGRRQRMPMLHR